MSDAQSARSELIAEHDESDPLRHLNAANDSDLAGGLHTLVPDQRPSIHNQFVELHFPLNGSGALDVKLLLDASPGCGGVTWPAGEVLSSYLGRRGSLRGKTVVELGSGTGLVGLVTGLLGAARTWITDQAPLLGIMRQNVALNDLSSRLTVSELNWGDPLPDGLPRQPDLILAADCVYFEPAFPLLVQTLTDLTSRDETEVLFCYKKRRKADKRFFSLLRKHFDWIQVDDDQAQVIYSRQAISLLRLIRKK